MRRSLVVALLFTACGTTEDKVSLYPERPDARASPPLADPPLQRPTLHVALTQDGLTQLMHVMVPREGSGAYAFMGERAYSWQRTPFVLKFDDARKAVLAHTDVTTHVELPGAALDLAMGLDADVQPVLSADHKLVLQAVTVKVTSTDKRVRLAEWGAGLVTAVEAAIKKELETLHIDLAPTLLALHDKLAQPVFFPLGNANACFALDVRGIEAGPSIFAGGFEKQLALVVAPAVTLPCTVRGQVVSQGDTLPKTPPLPALHNASSIEGGPFTLELPIAAGYQELDAAMALAFTKGKLFFSTDQPELYLFEPHVFASDGAVVVSVRVGGTARAAGGVPIGVEGELFLTGHPRVRDNFLEVPDIAPTLETDATLLKLAIALKREELTAAVKHALRLDLGARLASMKQNLVDALTVSVPVAEGVPPLCTRAELGRVEISSVEAHDPYLRVTLRTTATAAAYLPCPTQPEPAAPLVGTTR